MLYYGEITFLLSELHPVIFGLSWLFAIPSEIHTLLESKFCCIFPPRESLYSFNMWHVTKMIAQRKPVGWSLSWWSGWQPCMPLFRACWLTVGRGQEGTGGWGDSMGWNGLRLTPTWNASVPDYWPSICRVGWRWMRGAKSSAGCNPLPSVYRCVRAAVHVQQYVSQPFASAPALTKLEFK